MTLRFLITMCVVLSAPVVGLAAGDAQEPLTLGSVLKSYEFWGAVINFTCLLLLLGYGVKKFGNPALKKRSEEIKASLEEAQRLKAEAEEKHAEYQSRLNALDTEVKVMRDEMVSAAQAERARLLADAQEKAERMRRDTAFLISQQMKQLRDELTEETVVAAVAGAETLLNETTTAADQDRLADGYLKSLGSIDPRGSR